MVNLVFYLVTAVIVLQGATVQDLMRAVRRRQPEDVSGLAELHILAGKY